MSKKKYKPRVILASEGLKPIFILAIITLILVFLKCNLLALVTFIIMILTIIAFRDLERFVSSRYNNIILAPCDGIIKDINIGNNKTNITIKINIFNCGAIRTPTYVDTIDSRCKFGLSAPKQYNISILNTKCIISGIKDNNIIYTITLMPKIWNKISIYNNKSLIIGDRIGFMKYGLLIITINRSIDLSIKHGDNIIAGETLIGKLQ